MSSVQGVRVPNNWNLFVKHVYEEGHSKDSNYSFKQALKDASLRKDKMVGEHLGGKKTKKRGTKRKGTKRKGRKGKKTIKRRK